MTDYLESRGVTRAIAYRTPGHRSGPITRLLSPGDLENISSRSFFWICLSSLQHIPAVSFLIRIQV